MLMQQSWRGPLVEEHLQGTMNHLSTKQNLKHSTVYQILKKNISNKYKIFFESCMSYNAILFNTVSRTLQPTERHNIIQNETQMIKKCYEMKINNGKTELNTVTVPHFKVKQSVMVICYTRWMVNVGIRSTFF